MNHVCALPWRMLILIMCLFSLGVDCDETAIGSVYRFTACGMHSATALARLFAMVSFLASIGADRCLP